MTNPCAAFTMSSQPLRRPDQFSLILAFVSRKFGLIEFCFWIGRLNWAVKGYDWLKDSTWPNAVSVKVNNPNDFFPVNLSDENELPFDFYETNTFGCNLSEFII